MKKNTLTALLTGFICLIFLVGCPGGGESDNQTKSPTPDNVLNPSPDPIPDPDSYSNPNSNPDPEPSPVTGGIPGINGPLQGRLVYGDIGSTVLDLATGEEMMRYRAGIANQVDIDFPTADAQEWVNLERTSSIEKDIDSVVIRDQDGLKVSAFDIPTDTVSWFLKLSPDRQTIATFWMDEAAGETEKVFTLFSRNGSSQQRPLPSQTYYFDWLPNGELLYLAGDGDMYLTSKTPGVNPP